MCVCVKCRCGDGDGPLGRDLGVVGVEFLRVLGSQSGVSVWQHTLGVGLYI